MAKQIIRLTESDIHHLIENTVKKMMVKEDWTKSYDDWADNPGAKDAHEKNRKWTDELKKEHPDKAERRTAVNKHFKKRDVAAGKTSDKKYWRDYEKDMNESLTRMVDEAVKKALDEMLPPTAGGGSPISAGGAGSPLAGGGKNKVNANAKDSLNGNTVGSGNNLNLNVSAV